MKSPFPGMNPYLEAHWRDVHTRFAKYRHKQRAYMAGGVNRVEIDLVRKGEFVLAVPLEKIPTNRLALYGASIRRAARPVEAAYFPMPLREKLRVLPIPLRPREPDVTLDLQELIDMCYTRGRYASIDYRQDPDPPLLAEDAQWADELLRNQGLRTQDHRS